MGLRVRLILIVTLCLGVSLAASVGVLLRLEEEDLRHEASQRTAGLLAALAAPISVLLTQGRMADLDNLMGELEFRARHLQLRSIVLVDANGIVLTHAAADGRGDVSYGQALAASDPFVKRAIEARRALQDPPPPARPRRVSMPVQAGIRWATLIGTLDEVQLQATLVERRIRLVVSAAVVAAVGLVILLLLLSWEVLTPMGDIARMATRMADGDLKARAPVRGASEMQVLASTLNEAARQLSATHEELEAEVVRRTEELSNTLTELKGANERLERLALTDPLTGLFNRRYLDQALALEVTRQRRQKRPFSVLMIDVDHFKHYNDTHGHPRGDDVLKQLARILHENVRASDVVARVGGEEFVILLLDTELPHARTGAEKLRDSVVAHDFPFGAQQPGGRLTVSVGVASWPKHGETAEEVLEAADRALYLSKAAGRNRITPAPDLPSGAA